MTDFVKDSIEYKVLQIWQEVLSNSNANINSNFFELGGHSLLIFQLISSINEEFNADIPPSHIIQHPTPRELSNELRKKMNQKSSSVVTFNTSTSNKQLIFLHPGGGGVFCYTDLINELECDYTILGVQCPGIDDDEEPYWNLDKLTDLYKHALIPYLENKSNIFIGWSSGGSFAHNLIEKISSYEKFAIEKLILIDTLAEYPNKIEKKEHENYEKFVWKLFCESKNVSFENIESMSINDIIKSMNNNAYKLGILDKKIDRSLAEKELKVSVANFNILRSENFNVLIDVPIYWIISEDHLYNDKEFKDYHEPLWRKRTSSSFYTLSSPGTHKNMVFTPYAGVLSKKIEAIISSDL